MSKPTMTAEEALQWAPETTKALKEVKYPLGTLREGEFHPSAHIAMAYLKSNPLRMYKWQEPLASCALAGNRLAQVSCETLRRVLNGEPVSDRYLMGLAWMVWEMENDEANRAADQKRSTKRKRL